MLTVRETAMRALLVRVADGDALKLRSGAAGKVDDEEVDVGAVVDGVGEGSGSLGRATSAGEDLGELVDGGRGIAVGERGVVETDFDGVAGAFEGGRHGGDGGAVREVTGAK